MKCRVEKSVLEGNISCPPNKSYTHRAVFIASLANGTSTVHNVLLSRDTQSTIDACKKFGAKITKIKNHEELDNVSSLRIDGVSEIGPPRDDYSRIKDVDRLTIDASNSGTTIRIACSIAALAEDKFILTGDTSLKKRPMQPLLDALLQIGATCESSQGKPPVTIMGKVRGGIINITGSISSQFVSALMISAPLMEQGLRINIQGNLVSKPYIDITVSMMQRFGVKVDTIQSYQGYKIEKQRYSPTDFSVPSDFSSLALLLSAMVLVGEKMQVQGNFDDGLPQGDRVFLSYLKRLGVGVFMNHGVVTVDAPTILMEEESEKEVEFDLSNNPDLLPPLSILSLKSAAKIVISNVKHARFKETDRIAIVSSELSKLGVNIKEKEDGLILFPVQTVQKQHHEKSTIQKNRKEELVTLESHEDHRLFMAFCIAGLFVGNCYVTDPESVDVSFPGFIENIQALGAQISCQD